MLPGRNFCHLSYFFGISDVSSYTVAAAATSLFVTIFSKSDQQDPVTYAVLYTATSGYAFTPCLGSIRNSFKA